MKGELIRCIDCQEVLSLSEYDFSPEFQDGEDEIPQNDRESFELRHQQHRTEKLVVKEDSYVSRFPYWEPVSLGYFETTNGQENFVIKRWRERIDQPMRYELLGRGHIHLTEPTIEVQEEEIRKQIRAEQGELKIVDFKIDALITFLKVFLKFWPFKNIYRYFLSQEELIPGESPLVAYTKLTPELVKSLLKYAKKILEKDEYSFIKDFIERHNSADDVFGLRIRHKFELILIK